MKTKQIRVLFHETGKTAFYPHVYSTTNRAGDVIGHAGRTGASEMATEWFPSNTKTISTQIVGETEL